MGGYGEVPLGLIHVGIVNDFAREVDGAIRESTARLVGVVARPIHAVAEPTRPREVDGHTPGPVLVGRVSDPVDELAVVVGRQRVGDRVLETESLAKDQ